MRFMSVLCEFALRIPLVMEVEPGLVTGLGPGLVMGRVLDL